VAPGSPELGREGRAAVRWPRAGRSNSSERFRPRGGDLGCAKAWAGFSRGRGDTGNHSGEITRLNRPATARARRTAAVELRRRRNWTNTWRNKGKMGTGTDVSPRGGARGGLARSPVS
jgi:hypothetical protein